MSANTLFKKLPHIDHPNTYQFITFRTHDSTDSFLSKLSQANFGNSQKQFEADVHLDASPKGTYLKGEVLAYLMQVLRKYDGESYELVAFCVMPNHVHLLVKPLIPLDKVMRLLKGTTARSINKLLGRSGRLWAKDYYDRGIRDGQHFSVVYRYIRNNPLRLHKTDELTRFYGIYGDLFD